MIMQFSSRSTIVAGITIILLGLLSILLIPVAAGADVEIEGFLGETFTFHGFSYVGDYVYLFMTGPNLPVNGVTLTDISQRADKGQFTVVPVDAKQEWTYIWKTSRIASEIDAGTYIVYVTNEPADLSHLSDTSSYKTYSVFLKDSGLPKVSIKAEHAYTQNPADYVSTSMARSVNITSPVPTVSTAPPVTTIPETSQTASPVTRAGTGPLNVMIALLCFGYLVFLNRSRS
jgi:hypothetical protein